MNYKALIVAAAVLMAIGCGKSDGDDTGTGSTGEMTTGGAKTTGADNSTASGGVAGTYSMTQGGTTVTLTLDDAGGFTLGGAGSTSKGTYTKEGDSVVLTVAETDGKAASEEQKKDTQTLKIGADGSLSNQVMSFKKQ
jgi:hypothetical protein